MLSQLCEQMAYKSTQQLLEKKREEKNLKKLNKKKP